jgi:deazaflavin-dependent oxidoreductase (nitroreductase family)
MTDPQVRDGRATALPYGPIMSALLRPLQHGFLIVNRFGMAPAIRMGLGPLVGNPFTGHLMVLRTMGRRSGQLREAPLGYVIRGGCVYCVAGYGRRTPWYLNLLDEPGVEVILPGRTFRGRAEPVDDAAEWLAAYRALLASFGLLGRSMVGDIRTIPDAELLDRHRALPVVRITPVDPPDPLVPGPFDPGGRGWLVLNGALLGLGLLAWRRIRKGS